ncbi:MAG: signal peptidase II [Clostridia bacterium]|nr:signal peptidase II [Clostridia bacterium]
MNLIISSIIIVASILLDQLTKFIVQANFSLGDSMTVIPGFLNFTYIHNTGSAFGMMKGQMLFFYIITIVALGFFFYYLYKTRKENIIQSIILSVIIGGTIGNFIDRVAFQYVRDFIAVDIPTINFHFAIFNVADIFLVVGVIAFILYLLIDVIKEFKKPEDNIEEKANE